MDDSSFLRWSETLALLRQERQQSIEQELQSKADSFEPASFFDLAMGSLDQIMEKWFALEQQSWENDPPADQPLAIETIRAEMESVIDFEIEAIERDRAAVQARITWDANTILQVEPSYKTFQDELRNKYQLKVASLGGASRKKPATPTTPAIHAGYSRAPSGNGISFFVMFLVGLLLGGGPSIYFMDVSKKAEKKYQEERSKIIADQRALADSMTLLQDTFDQIATGKMKSLPDIDREVARIKERHSQQIQDVNREYLKERERALKKIPAGDKLDRALDLLVNDKDEKIANIMADQKEAIEPLTKQKARLKELMVH